MRKNRQTQPSLAPSCIDHPHARELAAISLILESTPKIAELATADLVGASASRLHGAPGMSGDQVVRAAIIKQMNGYSYEDLAFHLADSASYQAFLGIGLGDQPPKRSTLADNIGRLTPDTWEEIHRAVVRLAVRTGVETVERVRVDATAVDANIRMPADSEMLLDTVRVLTRWMKRAREAGHKLAFRDRTRLASRRATDIRWTHRKEARLAPYRDLVDATSRTIAAAREALTVLGEATTKVGMKAAAKLKHYLPLGEQVVAQTRRRVLEGESVPSDEKIVSIFEEHTSIIVKGRRDTQYGHKVTFAVGQRGIVLDAVVEDGNPADSTLVQRSVERSRDALGTTPKQMAFDGSYASRANLEIAKSMGVEDVCFSKSKGLDVEEMSSTKHVHRELWKFRAGVEGWISLLKRRFGLDRCTWRGLEAFRSYVFASIVACNLLTIVRRQAAA